MVSPVLLALALKDKWKSDVHEPSLPMAMLTAIAGATLFTGICPTLACCASERFPTACVRLPSVTRGLTATVSSACLLFIACWISYLSVVSDSFVFVVGFLSGIFLLLRAVSYWLPHDQQQQLPKLNHPEEGEDRKAKEKELCAMVDKSHEFMSGVTGILFLALEGMALEGLAMTSSATPAYNNPGTDSEHALLLRPHMSISFLVCAVGVVLIFLEMVPPRGAAKVLGLMYCADAAMAAGTGALLTAVVSTAMGKRKTKAGFLFLFFPFLIFIQLVYRVTINARNSINGRRTPGDLHAAENPVEEEEDGGEEEAKPAPMGLTKVTFTGFLVVSVKAISGGSPSGWTLCFLLFAAAAIVSGLSWRLLTHAQNKVKVGKAAADEAANVAAFCTHLCVAVATVLFAVVAWEAAAAGRDDERQHVSAAACAHVSQVTCVHLDKILDVQNVRNMCTCIDPCRN